MFTKSRGFVPGFFVAAVRFAQRPRLGFNDRVPDKTVRAIFNSSALAGGQWSVAGLMSGLGEAGLLGLSLPAPHGGGQPLAAENKLLLALGEHPGVAELLPELARLCDARAMIVPVDNVAWLPPGLMRQLAGWLAEIGVAVVFPKPFCSLTETHYGAYRRQVAYDIPLVAECAARFGRPTYTVTVDADTRTIQAVQVRRDSPCGCAGQVAAGLVGVPVDEAHHAAGMLHHHFPCLAGMVVDPDYADTLMHVSGRILQEEVDRNVRAAVTPPRYLRPGGRSE